MNQGFQPAERQQRHSTLSHQHRMHPDISRFPRDEFYSHDRRNRSLLDGSQVASARAWDYNAYPSRSHWLHVSGKVVRNRNEKEVKAVIAELDRFCGWAARQDKTYDVAVLTFYKGQESALREALQKLPGNAKAYSRFTYKGVAIKLATVDFFQGQEADLVILSMVNTHRDGFMDSPNRLNVSITRARYQLLIVGDRDYFAKRSRTQELKALAQACSFQGTHE
ncbi:AAA domain-containing protein [Marinobacterium aestuariivivens]|uniref:AAA domain-containing protein n=1 Tax=Marinobacterium aestuariivivens TaxID=1698799 RepID=A0ABW1ZZX7_9GAMM